MDNIHKKTDYDYENITRQPGLLDRKLLEMIAHAAAGEAAAKEYYLRLSGMLISTPDKKTVNEIALDEAKHQRLFEELYYNISGKRVSDREYSNNSGNEEPWVNAHPESAIPTGSLPSIFEERVHDELHDTEFYRHIFTALSNLDYRDLVFEIMVDEMRHAAFMNLLYAKYKG